MRSDCTVSWTWRPRPSFGTHATFKIRLDYGAINDENHIALHSQNIVTLEIYLPTNRVAATKALAPSTLDRRNRERELSLEMKSKRHWEGIDLN